MSRTTVAVSSFLVLAFSASMAAEVSPSAANLSAEEVVTRNVAARGGLQPWRAVQTLSISGKMDAGGNEASTRLAAQGSKLGGVQLPKRPKDQAQLPFRMELKRTRKSRLEIDFRGKTAIQVYDGTKGWKLRPFLNRHEVEPFSADELKVAAMQSDLDGPLVDYAAKGTTVALEGTDKVDGSDAYRLKLTFKNGSVQHLWIDSKTFLEAKAEGTPRRLDGKPHSVEVYYRDFRPVSGLMIPFVSETKVQGIKQTEKILVEKATVNPAVEDSRFAKLQ